MAQPATSVVFSTRKSINTRLPRTLPRSAVSRHVQIYCLSSLCPEIILLGLFQQNCCGVKCHNSILLPKPQLLKRLKQAFDFLSGLCRSLLMVAFRFITVHGNGTPKTYKLAWLRELQVHEWLPELNPVGVFCSLYNIQQRFERVTTELHLHRVGDWPGYKML